MYEPADLRRIVSRIAFKPWVIQVHTEGLNADYAYLQVSNPGGTCNVTGAPKPWTGRKWKLSYFMTETEVVKTALKAVLSAVEHEALERFTYRGLSIFDPHLSVEALLYARTEFLLDERKT